MQSLKDKFQALERKYQDRKSLFKQKIERWKEKGWLDVYAKGTALLEQTDRERETLREIFVRVSEGQTVRAQDIKSHLKNFKKAYKQLHEMSKPALQQWVEAIVIALLLAFVLRNTIFSPYHVPTGSAEPNILVGDRIWGNKMAYYFSDIKHGDLVIFDDPRPIYDKPSNFVQDLWQRYIGLAIPLLGLPAGPINVVKRVIGVPGDTIEGKIEDGKTVIYRNGKKLDEWYVNPFPLIGIKREVGLVPFERFGPFVVPGFLQKKMNDHLRYTYDPSKSFEDQQYYYMDEESVMKKPNGELMLWESRSPNYTLKFGEKEFFSVDVFSWKLPEDYYWVMGDSRKNSEDSRYFGFLHKKHIRGQASFILFSIDSEESFWLFDLIKHPIDFWTKHVRWGRTFKSLTKVDDLRLNKG